MSVSPSVRPSVVNTIVSEHKELQIWLLLPIHWLVLKMGYISPQYLVPPIVVKSVYWGLEHMERTMHTKLDILACMPTLNNTSKNFSYRSTGSGISHSSQIGILGS